MGRKRPGCHSEKPFSTYCTPATAVSTIMGTMTRENAMVVGEGPTTRKMTPKRKETQ